MLTSSQSLLDVSSRAEIRCSLDIELSQEEDSVQSLGALATKDGLILLAGINSSEKKLNEGLNEHLRSFEVKYPPRKRQKTDEQDAAKEARWRALGQVALFRPSHAKAKEMYQRILRLSPSQKLGSGSKRIGAVATGMAGRNESQIVVFDGTNATPQPADIITRIDLDDRTEAVDLDLTESEPSDFSLTYCTDYAIWLQTYNYSFDSKKVERIPKRPRRIHQTPESSTEEVGAQPKFRCVRFLNSENVLVLCNKSNKKGVELRVLHVYPTGPATPIQSVTLPFRVKQATCLDVCALGANEQGDQQFVVAVGGQDISIEVYTTNFSGRTGTFSPFRSYLSMKNVHEHQMTKICFSPFHPPRPGVEPGAPPRPSATQHIQLASTSYGNTVVVDTFPLQPRDESDQARYVLSHPRDERLRTGAYMVIISALVILAAMVLQPLLGTTDTPLTPSRFLPPPLRDLLDRTAALADRSRPLVPAAHHPRPPVADVPAPTPGRLQSLLADHTPSDGEQPSAAVVVHAPPIGAADDNVDGVTVDVHAPETWRIRHPHARRWTELSEAQKARWRRRLVLAGQWVEGEGEKVLLGVLFSEYAGLVGEAARERHG